MTIRDELLKEIDAHLSKTGTAPTAFGRALCGDPNFVDEIRGGRNPRADTIDAVRAFIEANRAPKKRAKAKP